MLINKEKSNEELNEPANRFDMPDYFYRMCGNALWSRCKSLKAAKLQRCD